MPVPLPVLTFSFSYRLTRLVKFDVEICAGTCQVTFILVLYRPIAKAVIPEIQIKLC